MHKTYMQRCLQLARQHAAAVRTNPMVGAVWVHGEKILGEGAHLVFGSAHAEVNALKDISNNDRHLIAESTLYVSLEPCFHQGKTPPCVELVLRYQPARVVIALKDPYPEVSGRSIEVMQQSGIEVIMGIEATEASWMNRPFLLAQYLKRPFIRLKFARDIAGNMGTKSKPVWMTGELSKTLVHKMRSECSAILVGSGTVLTDNPALSTRFWPGLSPQRIVLDMNNQLPAEHPLFSGQLPAWHITGKISLALGEKAQQNDIPPPQNHVQNVGKTAIDALSEVIPDLLEQCYHRGINHLLVEGGHQVLSAFLKLGFWDELVMFTAPFRLEAEPHELVPTPEFIPSFPPYKQIAIGKDSVDYYCHPETDRRLRKQLRVN